MKPRIVVLLRLEVDWIIELEPGWMLKIGRLLRRGRLREMKGDDAREEKEPGNEEKGRHQLSVLGTWPSMTYRGQ